MPRPLTILLLVLLCLLMAGNAFAAVGDANGDGVTSVADVFYLTNFLMSGGPAPVSSTDADALPDGVIDGLDVLRLVDFLFAGGEAPGTFFVPVTDPGADTLTVGTVTATGNAVEVPIFLRDISATRLGMDKTAFNNFYRIRALFLKVNFAPASVVTSATFNRSGVTASLTPTFETKPTSTGSRGLVVTFPDLSLALNASAPGDEIARLTLNLNGSQVPGSTISVTFDSAVSLIANGSGAVAEKTATNTLALVGGSVEVPPLSVTLSPPTRSFGQGTSAVSTVTIGAAQATPTTVSLSSSISAIAAVPATVTIPAGSVTSNFSVTGASVGGPVTITATLPSGVGGRSATQSVTITDPPPTVESSSPLIFSAQRGGTVTIMGTGFKPGAIVSFDRVVNAVRAPDLTSPQATVVSATTITATVPAHIGDGVLRRVFVTNPGGQVSAEAFPHVFWGEAVLQSSVSLLVGTNSEVGSATTGGIGGEFTVSSSAPSVAEVISPTATVLPLGTPIPLRILTEGKFTLTITGPLGSQLNASREYLAQIVRPVFRPAVLDFLPGTTSATAELGVDVPIPFGVTVQLSSSDPGVLSIPASVVIPANATSVQLPVTVGIIGTAQVTATLPASAGGLSGSATANVLGAPTLSTVTPAVGPVSGGTTVTLAGTNFFRGATVRFGGLAATNVVVSDSRTITAVTPARAVGSVNVIVTNTDGKTGGKTGGFSYDCLAPARAPALLQPAQSATEVSLRPALTWSQVPNAASYDVLLDTVNPPVQVVAANQLADFTISSLSFSPAALSKSTTYFWRVVAKSDASCAIAPLSSPVFSFTTTDPCPRGAPFVLLAPAQGAGNLGTTVLLTWQTSSGAGRYDVFIGATTPPELFGTTSGTSLSVSGLTPGTVYFWTVVASPICDSTLTTPTALRSFTVGGSCTTPGSFTLTAPATGSTTASNTVTLQWAASTNATGYDVYFGKAPEPPLLTSNVSSTSLVVSELDQGSQYFWRVVARAACDSTRSATTAVTSFTVSGTCSVPPSPTISFVPPGAVGTGQTYVIGWDESIGIGAGGSYIVERSLSSSFSPLVDAQQTSSPFATFVASTTGQYFHRVRAVPGCDATRASTNSPVRNVQVIAGKPNIVFASQPAAVLSGLREPTDTKSSRFTLENISNAPVSVILGRAELSSPAFFRVVDPAASEDAIFITLQPRQPKTLEVRFFAVPNETPAAFQGLLIVSAAGSPIVPYAFVSLKVGGGTSAVPQFRVGTSPSEYVAFPKFSGDDANRPALNSVTIVNPGTTPMELGSEIGPELWLTPDPGWNATPIPAGQSRAVPLRTSRNRAAAGSALPRYTYFTVRTRSGESARLLVQDNDATAVTNGRTEVLASGVRTYVIPYAISSSDANGEQLSQIRLTNAGGDSVSTDLYFTPTNSSGYDENAVKRVTVVIPSNDVVTLTDPLVQLFGLARPVSGQIEVRSPLQKTGLLSVSSVVTTGLQTSTPIRTRIPVARRGEGASAGSPHSISGIAIGAGTRVALALAETAGVDGASLRLRLVGGNGTAAGEQLMTLLPYGQKSVSDLAVLFGVTSLSAGKLELSVQSGGGSVVGLVTLTETGSGTSTVLFSRPVLTSALKMSKSSYRPNATAGLNVVVPWVVNGALDASGRIYRTVAGFSAPAGTAATFSVELRRASSVTRSVTVPAGETVEYSNLLEQLFLLAPGSAAEGRLLVSSSVGSAYARVEYTTTGSSRRIGGSLPLVGADSETLVSKASSMERAVEVEGVEQSTDPTRGSRWMLVLNEIAGQPATVTVRLYEPGNRSVPIAEKDIDLAALEQRKLDTVFAGVDLDTTIRRKDRTNVICIVTPKSGTGVVSAVAIAIDNAGGSIDSVLLAPTGGVSATGSTNIVRSLSVDDLEPSPVITSLSPTSGLTSGGTVVTILGTNFKTGSSVSFGGTAAVNVTVSGTTSISATTPARAAGVVDVVVTNSEKKVAVASGGFTYRNPAPGITAITPSSGTKNGGTAVTITGTGLLAGASVSIGGVAATAVTVASATTITATTAARATGVVDVVVTNSDGQLATLTGGYTYREPGPTVTSVAPATGPSSGGTSVTISGSGFVAAATVRFGTAAATSVSVTNSTTITATTPPNAAGTVDVTVTNPDATSGTLTGGFVYTGVSGDADGNGSVSVGDVFFLINHLFAGGSPPVGNGDADRSGSVSVADVFYLINFLFAGGPAPR